MKKLLVVAVALASVNAFATRARMTALGGASNAAHIIDTQTVFTNPADMFYVGGDFVSIESGNMTPSLTTPNANAEGIVVRSMGDAKLGLALGHQSGLSTQLRGLAAGIGAFGATFGAVGTLTGPVTPSAGQNNPLEISYGMKSGDMTWGATLVYSAYENKTATEKENTMGLRAGMRMGAWDVKLGQGLGNTAETATTKFKGTSGTTLGVGYVMDTMYWNANVVMAGFKTENAAGTETSNVTAQQYDVGVINAHKKDGNQFFYGAKLASSTTKNSVGDTKLTSMTLPVVIGMEVEANSWLTLRGSITQTSLVNSSKGENFAGPLAGLNTELSPSYNSTMAAVGAGLKFSNKLSMDGTLTGLTGATAAQTVNATTLLGQVGVTYMF